MATAWVILAAAAVILGGIHLFLFWWGHGPGKRPEYARAPGEPSLLPGKGLWGHAFGFVYVSPIPVFVVLKMSFSVSVEKAVFWALVVFIGGQLLLLSAMVLLWAVSRRGRGLDDG
jgi:hypothetical protein